MSPWDPPLLLIFPSSKHTVWRALACLEAFNIEKAYHIGNKTVKVLRNVNIQVDCGELVAIIGPSGAGKSTLLNILGTVDVPSRGIVEHLGVTVSDKSEDWRSLWRRKHVGLVLQFIFLIPTLTAYENVILPLELSGKFRDKHKRALEMLRKVDMIDKKDRYPSELSGGEQQRVAIARALVNNPEIIVADEPLSNLDRNTRRLLARLFKETAQEGKAIVVSTHEEELLRVADRICEMRRGELTCRS